MYGTCPSLYLAADAEMMLLDYCLMALLCVVDVSCTA